MTSEQMEMKELLKLFFSFFLEKEFIFSVLYCVGIYTVVFLLVWLF